MSRGVVGLACLAIAFALSCASTPKEHLDSARRAVERGDVEAARRELEAGRALEQQSQPTGALGPLDVELADLYLTYPELGGESQAEGLYKEALALYEEAYDGDDTKYAGALQRLGDYYLIEERWSDAIPVLERFVAAAPSQWSVDQVYESSQARGLAKAYGAVGRRADQAKLRELIDEPLARKKLAASAVTTPKGSSGVAVIPEDELYLEPNARDANDRPIYVHFEQRDMPLRVSLPMPDTPASDGGVDETRDAAADGIRTWQAAVQRVLPWFKIEIVDGDPNAAVQVVWSRRPRGYSGGYGEIFLAGSGGAPRARARITLSTQPLPIPEARLGLG